MPRPIVFNSDFCQEKTNKFEREFKRDERLGSGVAAGQAQAEIQLAEKYYPYILNVLKGLTNNRELSEDLAQDTFMIVMKKLREGNIRVPGTLKSYIRSTAKFHYYGYLRRKASQQIFSEEVSSLEAERENPELEIGRQEFSKTMQALLHQLSTPRDRDILTRHYLLEHSKAEIKEVFDLTSEHYDRVLSRARYRLKVKVEEMDLSSYLEVSH